MSLFYKRDPIEYGSKLDPNWRHYESMTKFELDEVIAYYRRHQGTVHSSNILIRIITSLMIDYRMDIWDFIRSLDATALLDSKTFGITSNINVGKVHDSVLLGDDSKEILIYKDELDEVMSDNLDWKELRPLRIMKYDSDDVKYVKLSDKIHFKEPTISIFSIDIKMLLVQYKYWVIYRLDLDLGIDPALFINQYVMTNTIYDTIDMGIINRFFKVSNNIKESSYNVKLPMYTTNANKNKSLRVCIDKLYKQYNKSKKSYAEILKGIPLIGSKNAHEFLFNIPAYPTKQLTWAVWLSKEDIIMNLFNISNKATYHLNRGLLRELNMYLNKLEAEVHFEDLLDSNFNLETSLNIITIRDILEKE